MAAVASLFTAVLRRSRVMASGFNIMAVQSIYGSRVYSSVPLESESLTVEEQQPLSTDDDLKGRIFRLRFAKRSATAAIERWIGEGREVTASELRLIAKELGRSQRYKHALEVSEWMKTYRESEFVDNDYAMRIDLIAKVFGVNAAEEFFRGLTKAAKSSATYTALLHSYAAAKLIDNAENLFQQIKESDLSPSVLTYNEMMTLYMSVGQLDKVPLVVEEMKKKKVPLDLFTYNLWISASAATLDVSSVRRILDEMAHDVNVDHSWTTYMKLTDIYLTTGQFVSSDSPLVEADTKISQREWITYDFLIILHAGLGNIQRIKEIWKSLQMTSQKMTSRNYICVLSSYLLLEQLNEAGEIIDHWMQSKNQEFDISACNRLFTAFIKFDLLDTAEKFKDLMLQKDFELNSSSH